MGNAKQMVANFSFLGDKYHTSLLEHAEEFLGRKDTSADPELAAYKRMEKPKCGDCYMNAQKFVISHPDAKYYEGYWWGGMFPVHHGWVVLDGQVIDFTAEDCDRKVKDMTGEVRDPATNDYFGMHVPTEFVVKAMFASRLWTTVTGDYLTFLATGEEPAR
ncbi:MAG: hypothetical protein ACREGR_01645, partial [Minisyncoccia bacterium]